MLTVEGSNKFDWENIPLPQCLEGNAMDSHFTYKVFHVLYEEMEKQGLLALYEGLLSPASNVLMESEFNGLDVSMDRWKKVGRELNNAVIDIRDSFYDKKAFEKEDNLNSPQDLIKVFYTREGGLELYPPDKTDKGDPATDAATIKILLEQVTEEIVNRG